MTQETEKRIGAACKETSLGWKVNVLYVLTAAVDVLVNDVDRDLKKIGTSFDKEKKRTFGRYAKSVRDCAYWVDRLGIDETVWRASGESARRYDGFLADARELLRLILLYVDRSHSEDGFYRIFRFLRSLPENGLFAEEDIARFEFKREWIPEPGDAVETPHGKGVIRMTLNHGDYMVDLEDGRQKVVNGKDLKL